MGRRHSFGWYVTIDHGGGYSTIYAHMQSGLQVSEGQQVSQGDVLGYASCTGYCTGPHIHFVLMHDGASVKPEPMCGQTGLNDGQVHTGCTLQPPVPPGSAGDPNCDGFVNSLDAQLVLQYEGGLTAGMGCPAGSDVNGDGAATVLDAALILQYNAGLISGFPP
ncbi:MAG: peptidoglycan DD-metalloendopeptidase family protein [Dehalococcoidia bacterium]|nr:peptidoglycan DD-metalloendopeptidase family protein [Dehalococcoidia bacterium]